MGVINDHGWNGAPNSDEKLHRTVPWIGCLLSCIFVPIDRNQAACGDPPQQRDGK